MITMHNYTEIVDGSVTENRNKIKYKEKDNKVERMDGLVAQD